MSIPTTIDLSPSLYHVVEGPRQYGVIESDLPFLARVDHRRRRMMANLRHAVRNWRENAEEQRIAAAVNRLKDGDFELLGINKDNLFNTIERNRIRRDHAPV